jgi:hypothetical protein
MMMASVPHNDTAVYGGINAGGEVLLNRKLRVMDPATGRSILVNALDECADSDCRGCCTRNANGGILIDLEKHAAQALYNFTEPMNQVAHDNGITFFTNPSGVPFDINNVTSVNLNRGLCYQVSYIDCWWR